jgi:putative addiction module component (TIGR02574 family)
LGEQRTRRLAAEKNGFKLMPIILFVNNFFCLYIWGKAKRIMSTSIIEEVSKLTKLEKIELARYLFDEITKEELDDEFELSDEQKADLDQAMVEIENGTADLCTGEEFSKEIKEKYGITVSLP